MRRHGWRVSTRPLSTFPGRQPARLGQRARLHRPDGCGTRPVPRCSPCLANTAWARRSHVSGSSVQSKRRSRCDDSLPTPLYFDLRRLTSLRAHDDPVARRHSRRMHRSRLAAAWFQAFRGGSPGAGGHSADAVRVRRPGRGAGAPVGIARPGVHARALEGPRTVGAVAGRTRVLLSCRTHYFRSLQDQDSHFTGHDRGHTAARDYAALVLLPFGETQIRHYLSRALPEIDVEQATALVRSVHNLEELAARPYTLKLSASRFRRSRSCGREAGTVRGVTLPGCSSTSGSGATAASTTSSQITSASYAAPGRVDVGARGEACRSGGTRGLARRVAGTG